MADYTKDNFADDLFPSLAEQSDTTPSYTKDNFTDDLFSAPQPIEPNSYWDDLAGAITSGYRDMRAGVAATGVMAGIDSPEEAADTMLESFQNRPTTPEYVQSYIDKIMAEGMDVSKAEGVVDTSLQFMDLMASTFIESVKNPGATGYMIAQSLANSIPSLTLGGLGLVSPVPGGFAVGTGLGTFAVEAGAHFNGLLQEKLAEEGKAPGDVTKEDILSLLDSKEFTDFAESEATKAGIAVSVVEAVMAATGLKIIKKGMDKAADKGVKQTFGSQVSRDAASFGLEVSGEGFGEAAKQVVTEGDMNYGDIALETITGLGQSAGTVAIEQVGTSIVNAVPTRKAKDDLDNVFGEGVDDIPADPLNAMLDEANAPTAEAPTPKAPEPMDEAITEALRIAEQHPDLQDAAAAIRAGGELTDAGVAIQLVRQALDTPFAQRTEGQQAMVQYARNYDAKVAKETATPTDEIAQALAGKKPLEAPVDPLAPPAEAVVEDPAIKKVVLENLDPALLTAQDKEFLNTYEVQQDGKATTEQTMGAELRPLSQVGSSNAKNDSRNEGPIAGDVIGGDGVSQTSAGMASETAAADSLTQVAGAVPVQPDNKDTTPTTSEEITDGTDTRQPDTTEDVGQGSKRNEADAPDSPSTITTKGSRAPSETKTSGAATEPAVQTPMEPEGTTEGTTYSAEAVGAELQTLREAKPKGIKAKRETKARIAELEATVKAEVDAKANEAATSPLNTQSQPTQEDLDSGDYNKGHMQVQGLDIAIENPKGSTRKGVDQKGKEWSSEMKDHYGYIKRTEGADGDAVDVFIGDNPSSDTIFVVDQVDPTTGQFDEHKVVIGAKSPAQAKMFYNRNYDKGWKGAAAVTQFTTAEFKTWLKESDTTKPVSSEVKVNDKQQQDSDNTSQLGVTADTGTGTTATGDTARSADIRPADSTKQAATTPDVKPEVERSDKPQSKTETPVSEVGVGAVAGIAVGADGTKTQALTPLPKEVSMGMGSFKPKPIGGKLHQQTSVMRLASMLRETLSNNREQGAAINSFVADNADMALGQGDNKGVTITFDGSLVSGTENVKPGTGIEGVTGKEYKTDFIGKDAIESFTLDKGLKLAGVANVFAKQQFGTIVNANGSTTYTRKTQPTMAAKPVESLTPTDDVQGETTADTTPTAMSEGGPTEPLKDVVPQPSTLYDMLKKNSPADVLRYIKAHTESPSLAAVIEKIIDRVPNNLTIKLISDGDKAPGSLQDAKALYVLGLTKGTNTIYLKDETFVNNGINDETVTHEMLHPVTVSLLEAGQLPANKDTELGRAVKDIAKLRNEVVREINRRIKSGELKQTDNLLNAALKDIGEFISWGLTNAEFQQTLKTIHVNHETVWSKFVTAVAKAFGIGQNDHTALEALMSSTEVLLAADSAPSVAWLLDRQRESSSFKHSILDVDKHDKIQTLEMSISLDEVLRDERLDIAAGRRVKQAEAEITQLQEEIQERRGQDPHFALGTDQIDAQGERLLREETQYMTLSERMHKALADKLAFWKDIPYIFGRMTSSAYFIENAEREVFGKTQSAELSATAAIHQAANSKVAASMVVHETGVQMVNGSIVPVEGTLGLRQVLEEVSKHGTRYLRRFEQYLLISRSKVLMAQGRENFVTPEDIATMDAWLERNPNTKALFEKQAKEFAKWNKNVLQVAIDAGWINAQDAYGGFKFVADDGTEILGPDNTFFETEADAKSAGQAAGLKGSTEATEGWYDEMYVPFYRVAEDTGVKAPKRGGKKPGDLGKATQKLKGGVGAIPILDNIMRNAEFLIDGSMKTIAMQRVKKLFENTMFEEISVGDVGNLELAPMVDPAKIKAEYADMKAQAEIDGLPMPELSDKDTKRWAALRKFARPTDKNAVAIFENGRATYYKVLDQKLLTAVKTIGAYQAANWIKIVGMPTRLLQQTITIMPAFLVRSFVRELQNTFIINSKGSLNPLTTIGKAVKNFSKIATGNDPWMQEMMAGGYVNYNTYFKATPENLRGQLEKAGVKKSTFNTILQSPWTGLKSMGRLYHQIAVATEHAARRTVYNDAIKAGATPQEAKYQALDMMNFGRRSDYAAMEVLLATVPFLNPRIQGMDRLYRGAKEDPKTFLLKGALMASAATALAVFNWEENGDEMEKLKDEDKALNFHLFLDMGGTEKVHWRIPKGFEVGQITGTLPEFAIEHLNSKTPEPVSKALNRFLTLTFGVQVPQAIAPMLAVGFNEDPFRQRPIISYGQQFLLPPAQFDTYTSKLIIDMAHSAPEGAPDWMRSPKKLEYLIKGYTGSLGAMVLEGVDDVYRATGNAPDAPTKKMSEMYILRDYIQTGAVKTSKQNDLFYDMVSEVGKLSSTLMAAKDYDKSAYREMKAENRDKLAARKALNKYSKRMSNISKEIKDVFESDLSPDMKALKKDRLIEKKNKLAQEAVDKYWYIFE